VGYRKAHLRRAENSYGFIADFEYRPDTNAIGTKIGFAATLLFQLVSNKDKTLSA